MSDTFIVNRGSDLDVQFNLPDGAGGNADLTGYTIRFFEVHPMLAPSSTVQIVSPQEGLIRLRVNWRNAMLSADRMAFRIALRIGETDTTTNLLWVQYR